MTEGTDLVVAASAAVQDGIAEISAVRQGIEDLKTKYANAVFDVSVTDGMEKAKAARQEIRKPRYAVERTRKESKSKLAALGKSIDSEAANITAALLALEVPIDDQIKAEEKRKEDERQQKIVAEQRRQEAIRAALAGISGLPATTKRTVESLTASIEILESCVPGEAVFQEQLEYATELHATTLATLKASLEEVTAEAERAADLARREEELERQRKLIDDERRNEREAAEKVRAANETIQRIRRTGRATGKSSEVIKAEIEGLRSLRPEYAEFGELMPDALEAIGDSIESLTSALAVATEREEQQRATAKREADAAAERKRKADEDAAEKRRLEQEAISARETAAEEDRLRKERDASESEIARRHERDLLIKRARKCATHGHDANVIVLICAAASALKMLAPRNDDESEMKFLLYLALISVGAEDMTV